MPDKEKEKKQTFILLAEDDAGTAEIIRTTLEKQGHRLSRVEDGEEVLAAAKRERPDLVVMDLMMPKMDGYTAANLLCSDDATKDVPVLVLSAKSGMKEACELAPNVVEFIPKPVDPARLLGAVKDVLDGKRRKAAPLPPPPPKTEMTEKAEKPEKPKKAEPAPPAAEAAAQPVEELIAQRRAKVKDYRDAGLNPFPTRFDVTDQAAGILRRFDSLGPEGSSEETIAVAGRLMTRRDMGKIIFAHVQDRTGRIQVYLRKDDLGQAFAFFKDHVDLGDHIGFAGTAFRTKTGEITIKVASWRLLAKALRPPPEKFHGMTDVEERYRRREVDLFSNEQVRERFAQRRAIVSTLRRTLEAKGFLEVETPMMQAVPGGAAARPFITKHETLKTDLYMRIAPELFLKRLLVGGMERVFEIGRAFRNEGMDTRHNPEFTIMEAYQAYTDCKGMMDLCEELIKACASQVRRGTENLLFEYRGVKADMDKPFSRLNLAELFREQLQLDYYELCRSNGWREACKQLELSVPGTAPDHKCFDAILDEKILPHVGPAAFLLGYPAAFSPLAKQSAEHPETAERFEFFLCGEEVANAYSEQNDPDVQRKHFEAQAARRTAGDAEAMPADEEFLTALEHGMPPAGGLGIGVDRLTMILTGIESIREVILFPLLRPS
jgi:lysyl-tRNA synthetase, class II